MLAELDLLQTNFTLYQQKYLEGNKKMQKFETAAKKLLLENEKLTNQRDLYRGSQCSGVGSCGGSRVGTPGRGGASGRFGSSMGGGSREGGGIGPGQSEVEFDVRVEGWGGDGGTFTTLG